MLEAVDQQILIGCFLISRHFTRRRLKRKEL